MILAAMRPQKTQFNLPTLYKYTAVGSSMFTAKERALMFGFTTYDALLVGGAGGRSGNATTNAADLGGVKTIFGAGGGGGGTLRLRDSLATLNASEEVVVGAAGGNGSGSGSYNSPSGSGQTGGISSFLGHSAYGGGGGTSADWNVTGAAGNQTISCFGGDGGPGGTNSAGLSGGGDGGHAGWVYIDPGAGTPDGHVSTVPTAGTYSAGGDAPVIGGGSGGGGGPGKNDAVQGTGFGTDAPRAGASGNGPDYQAAGGAISGSQGGFGGGADLFPLTGVHENYGQGSGGVSTGAVVIKLS